LVKFKSGFGKKRGQQISEEKLGCKNNKSNENNERRRKKREAVKSIETINLLYS